MLDVITAERDVVDDTTGEMRAIVDQWEAENVKQKACYGEDLVCNTIHTVCSTIKDSTC